MSTYILKSKLHKLLTTLKQMFLSTFRKTDWLHEVTRTKAIDKAFECIRDTFNKLLE